MLLKMLMHLLPVQAWDATVLPEQEEAYWLGGNGSVLLVDYKKFKQDTIAWYLAVPVEALNMNFHSRD